MSKIRIEPILPGWPFAVLLVVALLAAFTPARADDTEDEYLQVRFALKQAEDLEAGGNLAQARTKYQQALKALVAFQKAHPDWNSKMVTFRVNGVAEKITALTAQMAAPSAAAPAASASEKAGAAPTAKAKAIKLLDAGAEPRKELRLRPPADDKQALTMTMKMGKTASLKMTLDASIKQVADNGIISYTLTLSDISVDAKEGNPQTAEALKAALGSVKGTTASGTVSSQGVGGELKMQSPGGNNPIMSQFGGQMQDLFGQLVVPLPDEAVGVGAKWELKKAVKSQGMNIDQVATYELVSLEDGRFTIKSTTTQSAANQTIQNPAMPGMKVSVASMTAKTTGERTVEAAHVLPVSGTGKTHTETSASINMGGQKQAMDSKMDVEVQFEAK